MTLADRPIEIAAQDADLLFNAFDQDDAWRLGTLMVERALPEEAPVIIDIRRPRLVLFRSALAGTTEENEAWCGADESHRLSVRDQRRAAGGPFRIEGVDI